MNTTPERANPEERSVEVLYPRYWVVATVSCVYPVSPVMARLVEQQLDRWPRPRWVRFVDMSGAVVRLRNGAIESVEQSDPETRSLRRRFAEERDREDTQDTRW
jgi:hypothetical protein